MIILLNFVIIFENLMASTKLEVKVEVFGEVPLARFGHTISHGKYRENNLDLMLTKGLIYSLKIQGGYLWWSNW